MLWWKKRKDRVLCMYVFIIFLAMPHDLRDLSFPTRVEPVPLAVKARRPKLLTTREFFLQWVLTTLIRYFPLLEQGSCNRFQLETHQSVPISFADLVPWSFIPSGVHGWESKGQSILRPSWDEKYSRPQTWLWEGACWISKAAICSGLIAALFFLVLPP